MSMLTTSKIYFESIDYFPLYCYHLKYCQLPLWSSYFLFHYFLFHFSLPLSQNSILMWKHKGSLKNIY